MAEIITRLRCNDTIYDLNTQLVNAKQIVRSLERRLNEAIIAEAPKCETCMRSLWSSGQKCVQFVSIQTVDGVVHRICPLHANLFVEANRASVISVVEATESLL